MDHGIIYITLATIFGFFMAWGVGANDVANAMGTSVGSRALTIKQAIIIAAIFETAGALLAVLYGPDGAVTRQIALLAQEVVNIAKYLVPVDTGRLRASITFVMGTLDGLPVAEIGSNVEYAPFVEFGTRFMAAQPYLIPALLRVAESFGP